tara:strand:- start:1772 stop:1981 length:210 start_codon:yes stop_codon:yes gene_type:complete
MVRLGREFETNLKQGILERGIPSFWFKMCVPVRGHDWSEATPTFVNTFGFRKNFKSFWKNKKFHYNPIA